MNKNEFWRQGRRDFFAGLAILLPAVISVGVVIWLFGAVSNITDTLLFFVPQKYTHRNNGEGPMYWYWSMVAFGLAVSLTSLVGRYARHYLARALIEWADQMLLRVPLLNKIYSTVKQVNEAFSSNKSSFKQVVLVQFPRPGAWALGFITSEPVSYPSTGNAPLLAVFVPTTPNPTSGFLVLLPEQDLVRIDMSVADGIKFIVSLGSLSPETAVRATAALQDGKPVAPPPAPASGRQP